MTVSNDLPAQATLTEEQKFLKAQEKIAQKVSINVVSHYSIHILYFYAFRLLFYNQEKSGGGLTGAAAKTKKANAFAALTGSDSEDA